MRRIVLITLLTIFSSVARAEWVEIATDANATGYADPTNLSQVLGIVKMWELVDYKKSRTLNIGIQPITFLSTISQVEYDCAENKLRRMIVTFYSAKMGEGNPVYANPTPSEWVKVRPNTNGEALWKLACAKQ